MVNNGKLMKIYQIKKIKKEILIISWLLIKIYINQNNKENSKNERKNILKIYLKLEKLYLIFINKQ